MNQGTGPEGHNGGEPFVEQSKSSRNDLWMMILVSAFAFILFVAPMIANTIERLGAGRTLVPVIAASGVGIPDVSAQGATVNRADVVTQLADEVSIVSSMLVAADVLEPILWTGVIGLTVLLASMALRGKLFSRAFGSGVAWLLGGVLAAGAIPAALRHMGANGVIARLGWDAEPIAFEEFWIVFVLVTGLTLVYVMHRSGRRLADDQAGTV